MLYFIEISDQLSIEIGENKIKFKLGKIQLISKVIDGKFLITKKLYQYLMKKN